MTEPPFARRSENASVSLTSRRRFSVLATILVLSILLGVAIKARGQDMTLLEELKQEIILPLSIIIQRYGGRVDDIEILFKELAEMFVQVVGNIAN